MSLIILFLIGFRLEKPLSSFHTAEYLSLETGNYLPGLFGLVVILHHLSEKTEGGLLFGGFAEVGYLEVAIFFFMSGYGLQKSFITKQDRYKKDSC